MLAKSTDEIIETMEKDVKTHQVHIDGIDKCIKSADKQIADASAKRHSDLLEDLAVSSSANTKDATPAEFEALVKFGLMLEDKAGTFRMVSMAVGAHCLHYLWHHKRDGIMFSSDGNQEPICFYDSSHNQNGDTLILRTSMASSSIGWVGRFSGQVKATNTPGSV